MAVSFPRQSDADALRFLRPAEKKLLIRGPVDIGVFGELAGSLNDEKGVALLRAAKEKLSSLATQRDVEIASELSESMKSLRGALSLQNSPGELRQRLVTAIGTFRAEVDAVSGNSADAALKSQLSELSVALAEVQSSLK